MSGQAQVRLTTAALWLLVASGPVLGLWGLLRSGPAVADASLASSAPATVTAFAELVVSHHLRGPRLPDRLAPAREALRADTPVEAAGVRGSAVDVVALSAEPADPGRWGVRVLALGRTGSEETWQVTIAETSAGPVAESLPALLDRRDTPALPPLSIGRLEELQPDHVLGPTVHGFLRGLLTGDGDLDRFVAATSTLHALGPPAYAEVQVGRLAAQPLDADRVVALAEAVARRRDGTVDRLQYPLLLQHASGRWEVVRILPALPLAPPDPAS